MREKMTFKEAVSRFIELGLTMKGRARRSEFWYGILFINLTGIILAAVNMLAAIPMIIMDKALGLTTLIPLLILNLAVAIASWCAKITCCVRRLHDIGKSGWWIWILIAPYLVFLMTIFSIFLLEQDTKGTVLEDEATLSAVIFMGMLAVFLIFLAAAITLTVLLARPGTEGPNRYGPDPAIGQE